MIFRVIFSPRFSRSVVIFWNSSRFSSKLFPGFIRKPKNFSLIRILLGKDFPMNTFSSFFQILIVVPSLITYLNTLSARYSIMVLYVVSFISFFSFSVMSAGIFFGSRAFAAFCWINKGLIFSLHKAKSPFPSKRSTSNLAHIFQESKS